MENTTLFRFVLVFFAFRERKKKRRNLVGWAKVFHFSKCYNQEPTEQKVRVIDTTCMLTLAKSESGGPLVVMGGFVLLVIIKGRCWPAYNLVTPSPQLKRENWPHLLLLWGGMGGRGWNLTFNI